MDKTVLIFGGAGFIGTHLSYKLIGDGYRVICIDVDVPRFKDKKLSFIDSDVRDLQHVNINTESKIECIYNLAAVHTTPGHDSYEYYETNVLGANEVCAFAARHNINNIVFTSSISVYGADEDLKDESSQLTPNSAYGYSKMLAEKIHMAWLERDSNRQLTIVRPAVVFGPGEGGNFTRLASMMRKGVFVYPGRKNTIKSCIYVADLIFLVESARATHNYFELLNGAYPERYTLEDIIEAFKTDHFPDVKLFLVPKLVVLTAAKVLMFFNFLNIGIHPDRVLKLIRSTNVYPSWIVENKIVLPGDLKSALQRWADSTDSRFD